MESEYQILSHLRDNEETTQRKISKRTGLSLGAVNVLIKKLARKGFVKIERISPRTVRYILTPKGMKEKTKLTYQFIKKSYNQLTAITTAVTVLLREVKEYYPNAQIIIYGPADEIREILTANLDTMKLTPRIINPQEEQFKPVPNQLILIWRSEEEEKLSAANQVVNIMNLINLTPISREARG